MGSRHAVWGAALGLLLLLSLGGAFAPAPAEAFTAGAWNAGPVGCYCHGAAVPPNLTADVTGFPPVYGPGVAYTVRIDATRSAAGSNASVKAGFLATVSGGTFEVPQGWAADVHVNGTQATHTVNGSTRLFWEVLWRAPASGGGRAELAVLVNVVNGNGGPDGGDRWTALALSSAPGLAPGGTGAAGGWGAPALVADAALAAAAAFGVGLLVPLGPRKGAACPPPNGAPPGPPAR